MLTLPPVKNTNSFESFTRIKYYIYFTREKEKGDKKEIKELESRQ